jgi:membrane protein required for colicin V production
MFIDVMVLIAAVMAMVKGYSKGLIMALFNAVSLIIGLAAAVKLSALVASALYEQWDVPPSWAPLLAFAGVFMAAVILIRLAGKAVEKTLETVKIGFANRIGGIALYLLIYLAIASILVYYLEKTGILGEDLVAQSRTYSWLAPWGPAILDAIGYIVPAFRDMFGELDHFFDKVVEGFEPAA